MMSFDRVGVEAFLLYLVLLKFQMLVFVTTAQEAGERGVRAGIPIFIKYFIQ